MRLVEEPADFLSNPVRFLFNYTLVSQTLGSLTPENSVILVGSQMLNTSEPNSTAAPHFDDKSSVPFPWTELTETEPIYGTYFNETSICQELLDFWGSDSVNVSLSLPPANPFVPKDLGILPPPANGSQVPTEGKSELIILYVYVVASGVCRGVEGKKEKWRREEGEGRKEGGQCS